MVEAHDQILSRYWGKSSTILNGEPSVQLLVHHCLDVAAVGYAWLRGSPHLLQTLVKPIELGIDRLVAWAQYYIFLHDYGKADVRFQFKSPDAAKILSNNFWQPPKRDVSEYDHGSAGLAWFKKDLGLTWDIGNGIQWMIAVCSHHGDCARADVITTKNFCPQDLAVQDKTCRTMLQSVARKMFLEPCSIQDREPPCPPPSMLAGFCSVCDWVGSNEQWFGPPVIAYETTTEFLDQYYKARKDIAEGALRRCGLLAAKSRRSGMAGLFPKFTPRGVQPLMEQIPSDEASLTIIEASTGSGKTEAAMAFASRLIAEDKADSVIVALPTQATANAMLNRMCAVAPSIFSDGVNAVLAHGKAKFVGLFKELIETTSRDERGDGRAQCSQWLAQSRKRVFLGQIGVCTIDQVLLSVLPVRHHFVRRFGLSRSVLVVDEVHAYDSYMNGLLDYVLRAQKEAGGSVILLSATLDSRRKRELLALWGGEVHQNPDAPYPLVTFVSDNHRQGLELEATEPGRTVQVRTASFPEAIPEDACLHEIAGRAMRGECVAVICNVVAHAQQVADGLRGLAPGIPVDLFHSRFTFHDRDVVERHIMEDYGPKRTQSGRILVATQVVEQSLDLDFDFMVTQLCPVDLLFQRLGRLHRHSHLHDKCEVPSCLVLCPDGAGFGVHEAIYKGASLLWRTRRILEINSSEGPVEISFPGAYRAWIELVYGDNPMENEPEEISRLHGKWRDQGEGSRFAARCMAVATSEFPDTDATAARLTREGEMAVPILPYLESAHTLLDGTPLPAEDRLHKEEAVHLQIVSVPYNWRDHLRCFRNVQGITLMPVDADGRGGWRAKADGAVFVYDPYFGLRKEDA